MRIATISDNNTINGKLSNWLKKRKSFIKKVHVKTVGALKKTVQAIKTVSLVAPRNAFLLLVKLNVFNLAKNLQKVYDIKGNDGWKFWVQIGGNRTNLKNNVNIGKKKNRILGINKNDDIGEVVTTVTAAVTAAVPIILKVNKVFETVGIKPVDMAKKFIVEHKKSSAGKDLQEKIDEAKELQNEVTATSEQADKRLINTVKQDKNETEKPIFLGLSKKKLAILTGTALAITAGTVIIRKMNKKSK